MVKEKAGKTIRILSGVGLLLGLFTLSISIGNTQIDLPLLVMALGLCLSSMFGLGYAHVTVFDGGQRKMIRWHSLFKLKLSTSRYGFSELSTVHVRREFTRSQEESTKMGNFRPFWVVYVDSKGFGKKRRRYQVLKSYDQREAEAVREEVVKVMVDNSSTSH